MPERRVWKYELRLIDEPQLVAIPEPGWIVHVDCQGTTLCLWAEVWPDNVEADRWFTVEGTGHPIPREGRHVGTGTDDVRGLVWHVYEVGEPSNV